MNWWALLAAVGFLVANGFFVGAEFALTAARRTKMEELESQGRTGARLALKSVRELSLMLAGAQLGITMASLALGYVAEPAVAHGLESGFGRLGDIPEGVVRPLSFALALVIVVFLHMVVGEMAPKNFAIADPERSALLLAPPFRLYVNLFRPVIHGLNALANGGLRLTGVEPQDEVLTAHTADEIRRMVAESARQGELTSFERRLLSGAIEFGKRDAQEAMVPRTEMVAAPVDSTVADIERSVLETGHTRIPIYGHSHDNVLGFVHAKDLFKVAPQDRTKPISGSMIRRMLVVPDSRSLRNLLFDMRRERLAIALVVDEHGGTAGIVTLEDVLEELVGEIRDEYDDAEFNIRRLDDLRYVVPGTLRTDEAADRIGLVLPEGDYETIAGFLMDRLGRVPKRRDTVAHGDWTLRVRSMHRRRVVEVLAERAGPPPHEEARVTESDE